MDQEMAQSLLHKPIDDNSSLLDAQEEVDLNRNNHLGLFTLLYVIISTISTSVTESKPSTKNVHEACMHFLYLAVAVFGIISQIISFVFILWFFITLPEISIKSVCGGYLAYAGWTISCMYAFVSGVDRGIKVSNLAEPTCFQCRNVFLAYLDLILEFFYDYAFTIFSLYFSLYYTGGPMGFILNFYIISWISLIDNQIVQSYFTYSETTVLHMERKHVLVNSPFFDARGFWISFLTYLHIAYSVIGIPIITAYGYKSLKGRINFVNNCSDIY